MCTTTFQELFESSFEGKHQPNSHPMFLFAQKARDWTENFCKAQRPWINNDLTGACAIGSLYLFKNASTQQKHLHICTFKNPQTTHVFLKHVSTDCIIDITATQFGYPKVCILPTRIAQNKEAYWVWQNEFLDALSLYRYLQSIHFAQHQMPPNFLI